MEGRAFPLRSGVVVGGVCVPLLLGVWESGSLGVWECGGVLNPSGLSRSKPQNRISYRLDGREGGRSLVLGANLAAENGTTPTPSADIVMEKSQESL